LVWTAQSELGSVATSPIVTTAGTASRVADVVSLTGASSLIGQTEGTIFTEVNLRTIPNAAREIVYLKTADNQNAVRIIISNTNTIVGGTRRANTSLNLTTSPLAYSGRVRIAFAYKDQDYALVINGSVVATATNATSLPSATLDQVTIGVPVLNNNLTDHVSQLVVATSRIDNATLQSLTTL
jgi:hypothetical protein